MSVGAILLAAGRGERLGKGVEKALVPLAGRPLFAWPLAALAQVPAIEGIVVVGPVAGLRAALPASGSERIVGWCEGGRERQDSVRRGLDALPKQFDMVVVHDAARALVEPALIARCVADALASGASIAAVPLSDTLKRVALGAIEATVPRAGLWCAQTPQVFRREWLEQGHAEARGTATDDAALVEALGRPVRITEGDPSNFKITTPRDLGLAEAWLGSRPKGA